MKFLKTRLVLLEDDGKLQFKMTERVSRSKYFVIWYEKQDFNLEESLQNDAWMKGDVSSISYFFRELFDYPSLSIRFSLWWNRALIVMLIIVITKRVLRVGIAPKVAIMNYFTMGQQRKDWMLEQRTLAGYEAHIKFKDLLPRLSTLATWWYHQSLELEVLTIVSILL